MQSKSQHIAALKALRNRIKAHTNYRQAIKNKLAEEKVAVSLQDITNVFTGTRMNIDKREAIINTAKQLAQELEQKEKDLLDSLQEHE